ncbi:MAG: hypothetical protein ACUVTE_07730 [Candidatus Bathycorpusculaceae bacterium]
MGCAKNLSLKKSWMKKRISGHVERILRFGKVSIDGGIIIEMDMPTKDKVGLALIMRFLANHLEKGISAEVTVKELSQFLDIPEDQVVARLAELVEDKIAIRVHNCHEVAPS